MSTATARVSPDLTLEQIQAMEQHQIKKHHVAVVLLHWFNAFVWLLELVTGSAIITSARLRFMPQWYLAMMEQAFGSRANLLRFHIAVGFTWIVVCVVYVTFGWRHFIHAEVVRKEVALDEDDFNWLMLRTKKLLKADVTRLPPQGSYNAGQKLYALLVYTMLPLIMFSGLIMTFHLFGTFAVQWSMLFHFLAVGMVVSGLMVHVYMGAVFPEERQAFYSMITGMVNELYAYRHHFKWWAEVKKAQQVWETGIEKKNSLESAKVVEQKIPK